MLRAHSVSAISIPDRGRDENLATEGVTKLNETQSGEQGLGMGTRRQPGDRLTNRYAHNIPGTVLAFIYPVIKS
jgi:hypothetical protein